MYLVVEYTFSRGYAKNPYIAFVKNDYAVKIEIPFVKRGIAEIEAAKQLAGAASTRIP